MPAGRPFHNISIGQIIDLLEFLDDDLNDEGKNFKKEFYKLIRK